MNKKQRTAEVTDTGGEADATNSQRLMQKLVSLTFFFFTVFFCEQIMQVFVKVSGEKNLI